MDYFMFDIAANATLRQVDDQLRDRNRLGGSRHITNYFLRFYNIAIPTEPTAADSNVKSRGLANYNDVKIGDERLDHSMYLSQVFKEHPADRNGRHHLLVYPRCVRAAAITILEGGVHMPDTVPYKISFGTFPIDEVIPSVFIGRHAVLLPHRVMKPH